MKSRSQTWVMRPVQREASSVKSYQNAIDLLLQNPAWGGSVRFGVVKQLWLVGDLVHAVLVVCLNKDHLTGDKCYVWLVTANEQPELTLDAKMLSGRSWMTNQALLKTTASDGKLYVLLLSPPQLLFTTRTTQCGRCEAHKAITFNWGRESHY